MIYTNDFRSSMEETNFILLGECYSTKHQQVFEPCYSGMKYKHYVCSNGELFGINSELCYIDWSRSTYNHTIHAKDVIC